MTSDLQAVTDPPTSGIRRQYEIQVWVDVQWIAYWPARWASAFGTPEQRMAELHNCRRKHPDQQFRLVSWPEDALTVEDD